MRKIIVRVVNLSTRIIEIEFFPRFHQSFFVVVVLYFKFMNTINKDNKKNKTINQFKDIKRIKCLNTFYTELNYRNDKTRIYYL